VDLDGQDNTRDEFIELWNISGAPVLLYDPDHSTNTWRLRDAVDFEFPTGLELPPDGALVVVGFDPVLDPGTLADFRAAYGLGPEVLVLGPYRGRLANDTETLELERPDLPDTNDVPFVLVERVKYHDQAPWPAGTDGTGLSLQRISLGGFGNDPTNWLAGIPSQDRASPAKPTPTATACRMAGKSRMGSTRTTPRTPSGTMTAMGRAPR